jgi:hypothetical protein
LTGRTLNGRIFFTSTGPTGSATAELIRSGDIGPEQAEEAKARAGAAPPAPTPASGAALSTVAPNGVYDGRWLVALECPAANGLPGYTRPLDMTVTGGNVRAQFGTDGHANWLALSGQIAADGAATLTAFGLTEKMVPYGYSVAARFDANMGTGTRLEDRPCNFAFARR